MLWSCYEDREKGREQAHHWLLVYNNYEEQKWIAGGQHDTREMNIGQGDKSIIPIDLSSYYDYIVHKWYTKPAII